MKAYSEEFQASLPRSEAPGMDRSDLQVIDVQGTDVFITDGERNAEFGPMEGELLVRGHPHCPSLC